MQLIEDEAACIGLQLSFRRDGLAAELRSSFDVFARFKAWCNIAGRASDRPKSLLFAVRR